MPQAVDLVVPRGILLDVGIGPRQVRLGLEVVVVADEVLHRVVREELAELLVQLRGERLVVGHDQRRALGRLDHLGRGVRLAGPGRPEQHLVLESGLETADQVGNRLRLVAGRLERGVDLEGDGGHGPSILARAPGT